LSGRGLCDKLITRPEESYRLCCVVVCDLETSRIGAPYIYDIRSLRVKITNKMQLCGTIYCPLIALYVSRDIFAHHHQELLNCIFTASGNTYVRFCCVSVVRGSELMMSENIARNM